MQIFCGMSPGAQYREALCRANAIGFPQCLALLELAAFFVMKLPLLGDASVCDVLGFSLGSWFSCIPAPEPLLFSVLCVSC